MASTGEHEELAERFEAARPHLRAVAVRMLGSRTEADDAVQEAWLRLGRAEVGAVEDLQAWLTRVVARLCLDALRARGARPEEPLELDPEAGPPSDPGATERELLLAETLGPALLLVLDALAPAERVAFVLHDVFAVPFEEIARIVDRSPEAARQLASRARRRVRGAAPGVAPERRRHQRRVVSAFLAASRQGELEGLLALLDPDAVLRSDAAAARAGSPGELRGARAVAETFKGRARVAVAALLDGVPGAVWAPGGRPRAAFAFRFAGERIAAVEILMEPGRLAGLDVVFTEG